MANIIRFGGGGGASKKKLAIEKLTEGTIVKIKEKGVEQDYYLAQHDYQPSLNGSGRVLFVRKDCYNTAVWDVGNSNNYSESDVDILLNGEIKSLFDADVREAMSETVFPVTKGGGYASTMLELARSVFLLSITEYGLSNSIANVEGVAVPIADKLKIGRYNGTAVTQLTRTSSNANSSNVVTVYDTGFVSQQTANTAGSYIRWALTLHNSCTVLPEPNTDGSYTLSLGDDDPTQQYFNLTVVGGTEQPADVEDNTIWVNTDVDMGMCYLAPNAPDSPEVGDVWVNTTNKYNSNGTNASTNLIRVNDNPYLEINVLNISQWNGSAWVTRENSAIYANGEWTTMALWFYNDGTTDEKYPLKYAYGTESYTFSSKQTTVPIVGTSVRLTSGTSDSSYVACLMVDALVDFSKYNKYGIRGYQTYAGTWQKVTVGAYTSSNPTVQYAERMPYTVISSSNIAEDVLTDYVWDISSWTFTGYPAITTKKVSSNGAEYVYIHQWCLTA